MQGEAIYIFCGARRMCEIAAHLVDYVIPWVPVRQWVVTFPVAMRYWMASHPRMLSRVHTLSIREISHYYRRRIRVEQKVRGKLHTGAVTFVQKFGSALNLNSHFHIAFLEGAYRVTTDGEPIFCYVDPPSNEDVAAVLARIVEKVVKHLRREGFLPKDGVDSVPPVMDLFAENSPPLAQSMEASTRNFVALGERRGLPVRFIGKGFGAEGEKPELKGCRSVAMNGFTLHADTFVKDMDRRSLDFGGLIKGSRLPSYSDYFSYTQRAISSSASTISPDHRMPWPRRQPAASSPARFKG